MKLHLKFSPIVKENLIVDLKFKATVLPKGSESNEKSVCSALARAWPSSLSGKNSEPISRPHGSEVGL